MKYYVSTGDLGFLLGLNVRGPVPVPGGVSVADGFHVQLPLGKMHMAVGVGSNADTLCFFCGLKIGFNSQPSRMMFVIVLFLIRWFGLFLEQLQHVYGASVLCPGYLQSLQWSRNHQSVGYSPYLTAEQQREGLNMHNDKYYQGIPVTTAFQCSCVVHLR